MVKSTPVTTEIAAVSDLARVVRRSKNTRRLLFRGQNVDAPLLPKLVRIAEASSITREQFNKAERRMLERFQKESVPFFRGRPPANPWEWLSVAQHQGLPTRLLDWTANALAGLWFAVSADPPNGGVHGVLWVLDVSEENEKSPMGAEDIFNLKRTFVFQPFHIDQRIVSQAAWFSVHRYSTSGKFVPLEQISRFKPALRKYTIPVGRFGTIRQELKLMGITQASMFPDLSGLCADIQADCIDSWRPLRTI
jgi:hypothetical protein